MIYLHFLEYDQHHRYEQSQVWNWKGHSRIFAQFEANALDSVSFHGSFSRAVAIPTMLATFSVPALIPDS